mmetsp:Transcript_16109/g.29915  ORF Transcript_16109/g.29915 Transcript_16109/m.29915 type:complete len:205 (-) Transcript_16109:286-900(-)
MRASVLYSSLYEIQGGIEVRLYGIFYRHQRPTLVFAKVVCGSGDNQVIFFAIVWSRGSQGADSSVGIFRLGDSQDDFVGAQQVIGGRNAGTQSHKVSRWNLTHDLVSGSFPVIHLSAQREAVSNSKIPRRRRTRFFSYHDESNVILLCGRRCGWFSGVGSRCRWPRHVGSWLGFSVMGRLGRFAALGTFTALATFAASTGTVGI